MRQNLEVAVLGGLGGIYLAVSLVTGTPSDVILLELAVLAALVLLRTQSEWSPGLSGIRLLRTAIRRIRSIAGDAFADLRNRSAGATPENAGPVAIEARPTLLLTAGGGEGEKSLARPPQAGTRTGYTEIRR